MVNKIGKEFDNVQRIKQGNYLRIPKHVLAELRIGVGEQLYVTALDDMLVAYRYDAKLPTCDVTGRKDEDIVYMFGGRIALSPQGKQILYKRLKDELEK